MDYPNSIILFIMCVSFYVCLLVDTAIAQQANYSYTKLFNNITHVHFSLYPYIYTTLTSDLMAEVRDLCNF